MIQRMDVCHYLISMGRPSTHIPTMALSSSMVEAGVMVDGGVTMEVPGSATGRAIRAAAIPVVAIPVAAIRAVAIRVVAIRVVAADLVIADRQTAVSCR
jgi:hypothetical protein